MSSLIWFFGTAPTSWSTTLPPLNNISVGIPLTPYLPGVAGLSSTFILVTLILPEYSCAISSTIGAIALHGAHQLAQKSTSAGTSEPSTMVSNVESVTSIMFSDMYLSFQDTTGFCEKLSASAAGPFAGCGSM